MQPDRLMCSSRTVRVNVIVSLLRSYDVRAGRIGSSTCKLMPLPPLFDVLFVFFGLAAGLQ